MLLRLCSRWSIFLIKILISCHKRISIFHPTLLTQKIAALSKTSAPSAPIIHNRDDDDRNRCAHQSMTSNLSGWSELSEANLGAKFRAPRRLSPPRPSAPRGQSPPSPSLVEQARVLQRPPPQPPVLPNRSRFKKQPKIQLLQTRDSKKRC